MGAKRFTDTGKWDKAWFRKLSPILKCAWMFLCDKCDHAGVWDIDRDALAFFIGTDLSLQEIVDAFGDKVEIIDDKLILHGFNDFQYGSLNPENRVHKSVLDRLEKIKNKGLARTLKGSKDTDTDKDTDKDKDPENLVASQNIHPMSSAKKQNLTFDPEFQQFRTLCEQEGLLASPKFKALLPDVFAAFGSLGAVTTLAKGVKKSKGFKALDGPEARSQYLRVSLLREAGLIPESGGAA